MSEWFGKSPPRRFLLGVMAVLMMSGSGCAANGANANDKSGTAARASAETAGQVTGEAAARIGELADVWAYALQSRDGKPRYDMMSQKAKAKFEQEQIDRSGEDWNYVIGDSSPWVVDYDIRIDGMTARIEYVAQTSEPACYVASESVTFAWRGGLLVVDDYEPAQYAPTKLRG